MAQKKTPSKKVAKKKQVVRKKMPLYLKIGIVLAVGIIGFLVYRTCVNRYNVSLLDKAEAKMRELPIPPADYTTYERLCSFKSVKFGGAGSPICRIQRVDKYINEQPGLVDKYIKTLRDNSTGAVITSETLGTSYIQVAGMIPKVDCFGAVSEPQNDSEVTIVTTTCQKRTTFQLYPES